MSQRGVRLTGGSYGGRSLTVPRSARPTEGRVREALFSIWQDRLDGARFLDLFAGSGAVGMEAAGRGALTVLCVDKDRGAMRAMAANRRTLGEGLVSIRCLTLPSGLDLLVEQEAGPFDLVFADPPYRFSGYGGLLRRLAPLLDKDGEVAIEHASRTPLEVDPEPFVRVDRRQYGESALSFYRRAPD